MFAILKAGNPRGITQAFNKGFLQIDRSRNYKKKKKSHTTHSSLSRVISAKLKFDAMFRRRGGQTF